MKLEFFVPGLPKGAGSKRPFPIRIGAKRVNGKLVGGTFTGKFAMTDSSGQAGKDWRGAIHHVAFEALKAANIPPFNEPVILRVTFIMPRPKSHFRTGKNSSQLRDDAPAVHSSRPDATKLVRQLEDSLTNVAWTDDSLVVDQYIFKRYGEQPGAHVSIAPHAEEGIPNYKITRKDELSLNVNTACR